MSERKLQLAERKIVELEGEVRMLRLNLTAVRRGIDEMSAVLAAERARAKKRLKAAGERIGALLREKAAALMDAVLAPEPAAPTTTWAQGWAICNECGHRGQHVVEELPDVPILGGMQCPSCKAMACAWETPRHLWPKGYSEDREAAKPDAVVLPMKPGPQMAEMLAADPLPPISQTIVRIAKYPATDAAGETTPAFGPPFEGEAGCIYPACGPLCRRNCPPLPPKVRS